MTLARVVAEEALDHLSADDPDALQSRADLRRLHIAMRTCAVLRQALQAHRRDRAFTDPIRILELGAGDGTLMLRLARALTHGWPRIELTLLDRQSLVEPRTLAAFSGLGWRASVHVGDALEWAHASKDTLQHRNHRERWDLIISNLFLHHFDGGSLAELLRAIASRADGFIACEPRRGWPARIGCKLIGALGVNAVTRSDARLSVAAGFSDLELTQQWPTSSGDWLLRESRAGAFSHCFRATRREFT